MTELLMLPFELNVLGGGVIAALIGMIIGLPALRMRGLYLALVTLMAAAGFQIFASWSQFPNGDEGFWRWAAIYGSSFAGPIGC